MNSDKIKKQLGFRVTMTVPQGMAEIKRSRRRHHYEP